MMTVKAVSARTGVSVRTLQYYDKIGLLRATAYTESGYRLYDETALQQLQQILLFRELEFSLKDIRQILSSPGYDRRKALQHQITLLEMKKEHIEKLIALAGEIQTTGGRTMDFTAFDKKKLERYADQAREQWGTTTAYAQFREKSKNRSGEEEQALGQGLMDIFTRMGALRDTEPHSAGAQQLVKDLQSYISRHYYSCTKEILLGLGQMYAAGGEFTENIDAAGGPGTAVFACRAIEAYCTKP